MRSLTSRIGVVAGARVEPVTDTVAEEAEARHHAEDGEVGVGRHPPVLDELAPSEIMAPHRARGSAMSRFENGSLLS